MSDTDKQTLINLYEILIVKNLKEVHQILVDVIIKLIFAFKICKLTLLECFELPYRNALVIVASA